MMRGLTGSTASIFAQMNIKIGCSSLNLLQVYTNIGQLAVRSCNWTAVKPAKEFQDIREDADGQCGVDGPRPEVQEPPQQLQSLQSVSLTQQKLQRERNESCVQ